MIEDRSGMELVGSSPTESVNRYSQTVASQLAARFPTTEYVKNERYDDEDTFDLLTGMVEQFEKHAWFLHATLEG
jgi:DNA-binding ferritin-like protein